MKSQAGSALGDHHVQRTQELSRQLLLGQQLHIKLKEMKAWGCAKCWGLPNGVKGQHSTRQCARMPGEDDAHWAWQRGSVGKTTGPCWYCCLNKTNDDLHGPGQRQEKCRYLEVAGRIGHLIVSDPQTRGEFIAAFKDVEPGLDSGEKITAFMIRTHPSKRDWIVLATLVMDWWWKRGKQFGHGAGGK